ICIGAPASKILSDRGAYIPNPVGLSATHRACWTVSGIRSQIAASASLRAPNASTNFPCSASAAASFVLVEMSGVAATVAPAAAQIAHTMMPTLTLIIAKPPHEMFLQTRIARSTACAPITGVVETDRYVDV